MQSDAYVNSNNPEHQNVAKQIQNYFKNKYGNSTIDATGRNITIRKAWCWHAIIDKRTCEDCASFSDTSYENEEDISEYPHHDNYDAIEIPYTDAIPCDYENLMGVPVTFLDKYCPEQFDIIWQACGNTRASAPKEILDEVGYTIHPEDRGGCGVVNNKRQYARILIRKKHLQNGKGIENIYSKGVM